MISDLCCSNEIMMHIYLKDIATISSGQTFRGKIENDPSGTVQVIQMKDLNETYTHISGTSTTLSKNDISSGQLLDSGDILFMSKGNNNNSVVFRAPNAAVASSMFFVIRPDRERIVPEYLAWYLNSDAVQSYLYSFRAGATVASINRGALDELMVNLPSLKTQELIANIYGLSLREQEIRLQLSQERKQLIQSKLTKAINQ
ncbi:MAG: restriction endonuclease subunit S [Flavobacteriales bacterium]|nr:restriction endonuclease subunit S [Flavobacteriales bacterium]